MLLGPIFRAELVRTSRRRRYYFLRVGYGLALLLIVCVNYLGLLARIELRGGRPQIEDFARFATETFSWFAVVQLATILGLVPALFGGVIADEKQRKTMHYLMASRLSSGEIVLDKLAARLLHVGIFILLGLPVISLLSLFGGLPWEYVAVTYGGTFSITFFAAALATLVSTFARRVGQGVLIAYLLVIAWLIVPLVLDPMVSFVFPRFYRGFGPINAYVRASSPANLYLTFRSLRFATGGPTTAMLLVSYFWMIGLQVAAGISFLLLAVLQLRPTFRRQEAGSRRLTWFSPGRHRPRWLRRPDCGEDAMLWKERHFARTDVFTKLVVLPATILLTVALTMSGGFDEKVVGASRELVRNGYRLPMMSREELNRVLRVVSPVYIGLWLLAVAGASASGVTFEREQDTWTSLVSTPLTGPEILREKMIGSVWGLRGFGGLLLLFWIVGLVLGAVHPLGFLLALLVVGLITWFVAALGTYFSLKSRTSSRALTSTLAISIFLNGGYLVVLYPIFRGFDPQMWYWEQLVVGCMPALAGFALFSYRDVADLGAVSDDVWRNLVAVAVFILAGYAIAAALLMRRAFLQFDVVVDRPRPTRLSSAILAKASGAAGARSVALRGPVG